MSERIKLNLNSGASGVGLSVKIKDISSGQRETESTEDFFRAQLQRQYEAGFGKGYNSAIEELEKAYSDKLLTRLHEVHNIASTLENSIREYEEHYESILVQMSLLIAEKIVKREITDKSIINDVLKESLKRIIGANNVIVKISPADFTDISAVSTEILNDSAFNKIKFESDARIEQGGCFVESEIGNVDAKLSTQLGEIKKSMETSALGIVI